MYNSNGFVVAVLNTSGVNGQPIVDSMPGWQPGSGHPPPLFLAPGVTIQYPNGDQFHMGTTGNIYRGPASATRNGFGGSYGELRPGMISGLGLAGAGMGTPGMGGSLGTWAPPSITGTNSQEQHKNFWGD